MYFPRDLLKIGFWYPGETKEQRQHEDHDNCKADNWINPNPDTGLWVCRCCEYAHSFPTEDNLNPIFQGGYLHFKLFDFS